MTDKLKKLVLKGDNGAESFLTFLCYFNLIAGIFICLMALMWTHIEDAIPLKYSIPLFILFVFLLFVSWAINMLLINLSNNARANKHLLIESLDKVDDIENDLKENIRLQKENLKELRELNSNDKRRSKADTSETEYHNTIHDPKEFTKTEQEDFNKYGPK